MDAQAKDLQNKKKKETVGIYIDHQHDPSEPDKNAQLGKIRKWAKALSKIANILEGLGVAGMVFMVFMLWLGTKLDAGLKEDIVNIVIKSLSQNNFIFMRYWAPSLNELTGGSVTFWIMYVVLFASIILSWFFFHEMHELAYHFAVIDVPFTVENIRRVRNLCVTFFLLNPSVISLLMMMVIYLLFRYACTLQTESDETV